MRLFALLALAILIVGVTVDAVQAAPSSGTQIQQRDRDCTCPECGFIDLDGDGICDNCGACVPQGPDDDGDGIPNGQDEDYVPPKDGSGRRGK